MFIIKLTESEFNSLIESNTDRYYITSIWTGRAYTTGKKPNDTEGTLRILGIQPRKTPKKSQDKTRDR